MMSAIEAADEYRSVLADLTRNDKTQINLLTILAEDYASYAEEIATVIEEKLNTCPVQLKIVMLYVVDSIVKNIQVTSYKEQFAKKIVNMIVHVFKESDEKTRELIYRLRSTWTDIFPASRLYMIDSKIREIDKAWPVITPKTGPQATAQTGHVVHVNPRFLKEMKESKVEKQRKRNNAEPMIKRLKQDTGRIPKKTPNAPQIKCDNPGKKPESLLSLHITPPAYPPQQSTHSQASKPPNFKQQAIAPPIKRPRTSAPPKLAKQSQQNGLSQKALEPTAALGAHAFGRNVVAATHSNQIGSQTPPQPMDTSSSSTSLSQPHHLLEQPAIQQHPPTQMFLETTMPPQPQITPQAPGFPAVQHNIQNVTPRLPGVPENNRIFVDGKAYEVFYLDQVAVIERNGLPHRVSFAGPPRDVIIDGTAHRMAFGEQKQVLIDGEMHLLNFGAPSRELYMGHYPFKGAFGGPPIIATINGRRHEIRLCGPPPEVRIDPEPSYELMRYMPAIRQQQPQQQVTPKIEPKEPTLDVTSLLNRLKNSGILTKVNEAERKSHERFVALEAKGQAIGRSNSPPVPCSHRLDHTERRSIPMSGFDQFSMRSLIIRYDSIIDSIHRQRKSCQHCGIGFHELYGEAYQRHVDWHLQDTLKMKDPRHKYRRSQPWYMLDEWFNYSETEQVNRSQNAEAEKSTAVGGIDASYGSPQGQTTTTDANRDAQSDSIETKECQVCHEQFEEYWDEEEDVWRLRDCVIQDGKPFHSYCREDDAGAAQS